MRIELTGIGKTYTALRGRVEAVRGIDLTIADGELFVLLGPSGCGKSTLLNLLAGLERPSRGEIRFDGRLVAAAGGRQFLSARERNVAMVFQSYALYPHLSVFGNIAFPLRVAGEKEAAIREAVQRAAAALEIEGLLPVRPRELSGGQRQRVAIARAIVRQPQLFLLDEPLSNLDARLRAATRLALKRLQRELGITTVYVTHDQTEAMTLGDRIAVLRQGRVEQIGSAGELYERPASPFIAGFIGSPPMNLLPADCRREGAQLVMRLGGICLRLPAADHRPMPERCLLGIRPEHLRLQGREDEPFLAGSIEAVEPLGREVLLHVRVAGRELTVLGEPPGLPTGRQVKLYPELPRIHLFPGREEAGGCDRPPRS